MAKGTEINDFDTWNKIKKRLFFKERSPNCKRCDVWLCNIGRNIGVEQSCRNGFFVRPVLVLRIFNSDMFLGIPITSSNKNTFDEYYYDLRHVPKINGSAILSQIRVFDNKRLIRRIARIDEATIEKIRNRIISHIL